MRLYYISITMGVMGSLIYYMEETPINVSRSLKSFLKSAKTTLRNIAIAAVVTSYIVAPIVMFVNPVVGEVIFIASQVVLGTVLGLLILDELFDKFDVPKLEPPHEMNNIIVFDHNENKPFLNGKEYHIPKGSSVQLDFEIPYFNRETMDSLICYPHIYEP